jgi:hypothetical protein
MKPSEKPQKEGAIAVLEYLYRNIDLRTLFWSFPAVFLVLHEEEQSDHRRPGA